MGWGWSGWYWGKIDYHRDHRGFSLGTGHGALRFEGGFNPWLRDGCATDVHRTDTVRFCPGADDDGMGFLGFRWGRDSFNFGAVHVQYYLAIPYWFPLLGSSLLLLGAWRKTRGRPDPATAFPVEIRAPRDAPGGRG